MIFPIRKTWTSGFWKRRLSTISAISFSVSAPASAATYRTADELPGSYKVLAPIIEEVPKMLDEAGFEKGGEYEPKNS